MNGWSCNIHAKNDDFPIDFAIFTKALPTDGRTDGPTDRRTDIPSYRVAIAASKKLGNPLKKEESSMRKGINCIGGGEKE